MEAYAANDVTKELGFDRSDFIRFALLLGSDYTSGVKGVGIVSATEILRSFPGLNGLQELLGWVNGVGMFLNLLILCCCYAAHRCFGVSTR